MPSVLYLGLQRGERGQLAGPGNACDRPIEGRVGLKKGPPVLELREGSGAHQEGDFDPVQALKPTDLLAQQRRNGNFVDDDAPTISHLSR